MQIGAAILGVLGAFSGLVAALVAVGISEAEAVRGWTAALASTVGLIGAVLVVRDRPRLGALLMFEALVGVGVAIGEQGLIPGTCFLAGGLLSLFQRRRDFRSR
jgi:hypothetical protein